MECRCAHHSGKSPAEDSKSTPKNLSKDPKMALCTMIGLVFSAFSPSATTAPEEIHKTRERQRNVIDHTIFFLRNCEAR